MGRKLFLMALALATVTGCAKAQTPAAQSGATTAPPAAGSTIETPVPAGVPANTAAISGDLNSVDAGLGQVDSQLSDAGDGMSHNESGDVQ